MGVPAIHPGKHIAEELKELNIGAAALARKLKVPTNRITEILNGRRAITADTALRLGHFFGTSAEFWLNLQKLHELRLAEKKAIREIKTLPTLNQESGATTPRGKGQSLHPQRHNLVRIRKDHKGTCHEH